MELECSAAPISFSWSHPHIVVPNRQKKRYKTHSQVLWRNSIPRKGSPIFVFVFLRFCKQLTKRLGGGPWRAPCQPKKLLKGLRPRGGSCLTVRKRTTEQLPEYLWPPWLIKCDLTNLLQEQVCWMTFPTTSALSSTTIGPNSHPSTHSSRMLSDSYLGCYLSWLYWETRVSSTYSWAPSEWGLQYSVIKVTTYITSILCNP